MRDVSNLAVHELRAPLAVAGGYAAMLLDGDMGPVPESWLKPLTAIAEQVAAAGSMVDSLLLMAKLDNGAPAGEQDLDLVLLAREAGARVESRIQLVGGTLTIESDEAEVHASADRGMVAMIVDNLLNNALLYGGTAPEVSIRISCFAGPAISITDHGRGIAPELKGRVFERFFRVADPSSVGGSGLGLYLSSRLAVRQGGSVSLDWSERGEGSTFSLRLPAA